MKLRAIVLLVLVALSAQLFAGTGRIIIVNIDAPGVGFNDPTPRAPIGGNNGTTLGQQRLNVFLAAAEGWRKYIDTNVDIVASASFRDIAGCTETAGILGQASPASWRENFPGAPKANVLYPIALANKFAGTDLEAGTADISVQFNAGVDNATCLGASSWYYGFDGKEGGDVDLYTVVSHELGHGLGIAGAAIAPAFVNNHPSAFDVHVFDRTLGLRWDQMTLEQRRVSMTNTGNLVWDGAAARAAVSKALDPLKTLTITEPSSLARNYDVGFADFGGATENMTGRIVRATDAANTDGPTVNDGCSVFTNAAAIQGNVALVDRGSCTFLIKARNAQAAGATGMIIADRAESYTPTNPATCLPPGMHGEDAGDVTIPIISVGINDGNALKGTLTNADSVLRGLLREDPTQRAGASVEGYPRLYAPCVLQAGSSIYHWDTTATPNLLMEPAINDDLTHDPDLTLQQLIDLGWTSRQGRQFLKR
ncbi:MAG TPA: PA domain-containing protein [Thermoanaerobaculia bacterium]|nr:PA domain-containing protein [Thermoanaerobaculia bacterium]